MLERLVEILLVPPLCPACGSRAEEGRRVCGRCVSRLRSEPPVPGPAPSGVVEAAAAFRHENVARDLLNSFKFRSGAALAPFLASLLLDRCGSVLTTGTLVPVPPSSSGLAIRGFDTAALLVAELLKLMPDAVSRPALLDRPPGSRQLGSNRRDRLNGGVGIVAVAGLEGPAVLVDDVMTTGSTLSASARALRQAGTTTVRAVTFTRRP